MAACSRAWRASWSCAVLPASTPSRCHSTCGAPHGRARVRVRVRVRARVRVRVRVRVSEAGTRTARLPCATGTYGAQEAGTRAVRVPHACRTRDVRTHWRGCGILFYASPCQRCRGTASRQWICTACSSRPTARPGWPGGEARAVGVVRVADSSRVALWADRSGQSILGSGLGSLVGLERPGRCLGRPRGARGS